MLPNDKLKRDGPTAPRFTKQCKRSTHTKPDRLAHRRLQRLVMPPHHLVTDSLKIAQVWQISFLAMFAKSVSENVVTSTV